MKSLITIFFLVVLVGVSGYCWINKSLESLHAIETNETAYESEKLTKRHIEAYNRSEIYIIDYNDYYINDSQLLQPALKR